MKSSKEKLDKILPLGLLATRQYIMSHGVARHAFDNAVKSGKIIAVRRGVYVREGLPLSWQGVLTSLNLLSENHPVYIGGVSALELSGMGHYVKNLSELHIYSEMKQPSWLNHLDLRVDFNWKGTKRIWKPLLFENSNGLKHHQWREDLPPYYMASAEQACLEFLASVPNQLSFEYADSLFQGLTSLSPRKLGYLLGYCKSIKAKRLFFWFAKRHGFAWTKHLNINDYDLGNGKREIAKGGVLDNDFLITVPGDL